MVSEPANALGAANGVWASCHGRRGGQRANGPPPAAQAQAVTILTTFRRMISSAAPPIR